MSDQLFAAEYPAGLPIGDGWMPAPSTDEIRFPYDGSLVSRGIQLGVDLQPAAGGGSGRCAGRAGWSRLPGRAGLRRPMSSR